MAEGGFVALFGEDDEDEFYESESQVASVKSAVKPSNCASGLMEPAFPRGGYGLIGLYNQ